MALPRLPIKTFFKVFIGEERARVELLAVTNTLAYYTQLQTVIKRHYHNTYDITYNNNKRNILDMFLSTVVSKVISS